MSVQHSRIFAGRVAVVYRPRRGQSHKGRGLKKCSIVIGCQLDFKVSSSFSSLYLGPLSSPSSSGYRVHPLRAPTSSSQLSKAPLWINNYFFHIPLPPPLSPLHNTRKLSEKHGSDLFGIYISYGETGMFSLIFWRHQKSSSGPLFFSFLFLFIGHRDRFLPRWTPFATCVLRL